MSRSSKAESLIKIACCQIETHVGQKEGNIDKTVIFAEEAANHGADVILLPELANTGYVFETREEAFSLAEVVPGGRRQGDGRSSRGSRRCTWPRGLLSGRETAYTTPPSSSAPTGT